MKHMKHSTKSATMTGHCAQTLMRFAPRSHIKVLCAMHSHFNPGSCPKTQVQVHGITSRRHEIAHIFGRGRATCRRSARKLQGSTRLFYQECSEAQETGQAWYRRGVSIRSVESECQLSMSEPYKRSQIMATVKVSFPLLLADKNSL